MANLGTLGEYRGKQDYLEFRKSAFSLREGTDKLPEFFYSFFEYIIGDICEENHFKIEEIQNLEFQFKIGLARRNAQLDLLLVNSFNLILIPSSRSITDNLNIKTRKLFCEALISLIDHTVPKTQDQVTASKLFEMGQELYLQLLMYSKYLNTPFSDGALEAQLHNIKHCIRKIDPSSPNENTHFISPGRFMVTPWIISMLNLPEVIADILKLNPQAHKFLLEDQPASDRLWLILDLLASNCVPYGDSLENDLKVLLKSHLQNFQMQALRDIGLDYFILKQAGLLP